MSEERFVAVVGCQHYYGTKILRPGLVLKLVKEPENPYDGEAIRVELGPMGKVGYIANSAHTVPRGCHSAGRVYDTFSQKCYGIVRFIISGTVILQLVENIRLELRVIIGDEKYERELYDSVSSGP